MDREVLAYRRSRYGAPWHFLDFRRGSGFAVTNEAEEATDVSQLERDHQSGEQSPSHLLDFAPCLPSPAGRRIGKIKANEDSQ